MLDGFEMRKQLASWRVVGSAAQIIQTICGWVGLSYQLRTSLSNCAADLHPRRQAGHRRRPRDRLLVGGLGDARSQRDPADLRLGGDLCPGWEPTQPAGPHRVRGPLRPLFHQPRERGGEHLLAEGEYRYLVSAAGRPIRSR